MGTRRGHGQANEYASPDSDSDSDDVEDDWQAMRTRRKGEALQAATQSAATEHKIPKSSGFWGAFGEPTAHRSAREQSVRWSHSNSAVLDIADATRRATEALVSSQLDLDQSSDGDSIVVEREEDDGVHAIIEPIVCESFTELHSVSLVADTGSFSSPSAQLVAMDSMPLPVPPALIDDEDRMTPFYAELLPIASPNEGIQSDDLPGLGQTPELVEDALEGVSVVEKSGSLVGTSGRRVKGGKLASIMNKASKGPSTKKKVDAAVQQQEDVDADDHHAEVFSQTSSPSAAKDLPAEAPLQQQPLCSSSSEVDCTQKSPNWDTQLTTALRLVDLTAPVVSSFPFTTVNDRSSSGSVTFSGETLPIECIGTAQSSSRLVVVDILINKVQMCGAASMSGGSDLPWIQLLCWVLAAARQHFVLVAMAWGRFSDSDPYLWTAPSDDLICRIAFESRSPDAVISAADLLQLTRSTLLIPIISSDSASDHLPHHADDHGATVDTVILVKDSLSSDLFADLRAMNQDISNAVTLRVAATDPEYKSKAFGLLSSSHITVSVLRDYIVREGKMAQLSALVSRAEAEGLRLCGLRVAHLDSHRLFELEQFCSIPGHAKPVHSTEVSEVCTDKEHSLMVLAVAFHACGSIPIGECSPTSSILRAIMGPEDPVLAMKTDPQSLRAVFGGPGKESNISYPISHSAVRISKEVSFWFGGRRRVGRGVQTEEPVAVDAADDDDADALDCFSAKLPLLFFGQLRLFSVGVCFSSTSLGTHSSSALSSLQSVVLQSIANSLCSVGLFASVHSYSSFLPYRRAVRSGSKGQLLCSLNAEESQALTIGIGKKTSAQYFVWRFFSSVGDSYIRRVLETIFGSTGRVTGMASSPKARRTHSVLSGPFTADVWDVHLECFVASALSEEGPSPRDDDGADTADAAPIAVSGPTAATQQNGDMGVDGQSTAGSRLLAFELLKRLSEDDSKSHEDVGLSDMIVLQLSRRTTDGDAAALWQSADLLSHLMLLLKLIPPTCQAHILAMKCSNTNAGTPRRGGDDSAVDNLLVALRGYQILENIDYVVAEMMRPTASDSRRKSATNNKGVAAVQVTVARGRRACEVLFCEFPLHAIYIDLALRDIHMYVPAARIHRLPTISCRTSSAAEAPLSCDIVEATASLSSEATARFYVQALFPPGSFTASAVLIVPWHADGTTMTRNLGRVVSRLEKEGFELLEVKAVAAVDPALLVDLYRDNCAEYHRLEGYGMGPLESGALGDDQYHFLKGDAVAILVRRRSAMLRLKSVIGPIFDKQLLETQYPRSLMHLLHSLHPSGRTTGGVQGGVSTSTAPVIPFVLPTLTCRSTDRAIEVLFPEYHADAELPLKTISLNTTASSSSGVHESVAAADEDTFGNQPLRAVPLVSRWVGACSSSSLSPPRGEEIGRRRIAAAAGMTTVTHVDIAGIVVTHALLQESSLGSILEALHREELTVRTMMIMTCTVQTMIPSRINQFDDNSLACLSVYLTHHRLGTSSPRICPAVL